MAHSPINQFWRILLSSLHRLPFDSKCNSRIRRNWLVTLFRLQTPGLSVANSSTRYRSCTCIVIVCWLSSYHVLAVFFWEASVSFQYQRYRCDTICNINSFQMTLSSDVLPLPDTPANRAPAWWRWRVKGAGSVLWWRHGSFVSYLWHTTDDGLCWPTSYLPLR